MGHKTDGNAEKPPLNSGAMLLANLNSLILDYPSPHKVGGILLSLLHLASQFPVLPPIGYVNAEVDFIAPRVLELVYTAWDIAPFAANLWADRR